MTTNSAVLSTTVYARLIDTLNRVPAPMRPRSIAAWIALLIQIGLTEIGDRVQPQPQIGAGGGHTVRVSHVAWNKCLERVESLPCTYVDATGRKQVLSTQVVVRAALVAGLDAVTKALT